MINKNRDGIYLKTVHRKWKEKQPFDIVKIFYCAKVLKNMQSHTEVDIKVCRHVHQIITVITMGSKKVHLSFE